MPTRSQRILNSRAEMPALLISLSGQSFFCLRPRRRAFRNGGFAFGVSQREHCVGSVSFAGDLFDSFDDVGVFRRDVVLLRDIVFEIVKFDHRFVAGGDVQAFSLPIAEADLLEAAFGQSQFPIKILVLFLLVGMIEKRGQK